MAQPAPILAPSQRLKENLVKQALKTFAWETFKQHLSKVDVNANSLSELLGHIRRSTDFLIKRPDEARETTRAAFVEELSKFIENHLGTDAAALVGHDMAIIQRIEAGYREILRTQEATVAAKLLPDTQASAALSRSVYAYHELMLAFHSATRRRKELTLQSFRIKQTNGSSYSPDGVLAGIVDIATMTLMLLGHRYKWFDAQKFLVLPKLTDVTKDEVYKAGLTEVLAASWRHWERMEQRCRYFGGEIKVTTGSNLPGWVPEAAETGQLSNTSMSARENFSTIWPTTASTIALSRHSRKWRSRQICTPRNLESAPLSAFLQVCLFQRRRRIPASPCAKFSAIQSLTIKSGHAA